MLTDKALGSALREVRLDRGLRQEQVAEHELGRCRSWLGAIERGQNRVSGVHLIRLLEVYGITLADLAEHLPAGSRGR